MVSVESSMMLIGGREKGEPENDGRVRWKWKNVETAEWKGSQPYDNETTFD